METKNLTELENCCKNICSELSSLLFWKWDERLKVTLAEFTEKYSTEVHSIISKKFDATWDSNTISKAPQVIKDLAKALGSVRVGQFLFTTIHESGIILFGTWWPWGNNINISIRIGMKYPEKSEIIEMKLVLEIKKWFGLEHTP